MENLICIYKTYDIFQAQLVKSYLDAQNIFCDMKTQDASGTLPHLAFAQGGIEIVVLKEDVEKCQDLLDQIASS